MRFFVLTATYELRGSRKSPLRDHPTSASVQTGRIQFLSPVVTDAEGLVRFGIEAVLSESIVAVPDGSAFS
jgi:hypothetical protein